MRFMVMVHPAQGESGTLPTTEEFARMGAFNEELARAGVLLDADGLRPSAQGARIRFSEGGTSVVDGPFTESKELIGGFWVVQMKSLDEAKEWFSRAPMSPGDMLEIRPFYETEDFGDVFTPELQERQRQIEAKVAR